MFTGIIEEVGSIAALSPFGNGRRIEISATTALKEIAFGDSISINGVCLTVTRYSERTFTVEAVEETMKKTTFGGFRQGDAVNLERALRANGKLGGHIVQGHADCVGTITAIEERRESWLFAVEYPAAYAANVIPVGSISVDGVSLTVAEKLPGRFTVSIIPHTYENTLFRHYRTGSAVNLEFDLVGKYILEYLRSGNGEGRITEEYLRNLGY